MKNKLLSVLSGSLLLCGSITAQTPDGGAGAGYFGIKCIPDTLASMTLFTARNYEGVTYLHWDVACQATDGIYVVLASADRKNYERVGEKPGVGVPVSEPIAYYFQDKMPKEGTTYYKVIHIGKDQTCMESREIGVIFEKAEADVMGSIQ